MRILPGLLALSFALPAFGRARPGPPAILPLKTLRLYETGVGYFERSGALSNTAATTLPVPAGHLDDALKTLVVLTPDALSRVHGIEFGSSASRGTARALVGLPLDPDAAITYRDLLACMKGNEVAVRSGGKVVEGRLLDLTEVAPLVPLSSTKKDDKEKEADKDPLVAKEPDLMLLVLTRDSELRRFRASQVESVRPTDAAFAARLDAALAAVSSRGAQAARMLHMMARSSAPVTLGYIAETPVWRTTYRMIFDDKNAMLQGWALVHNDSDEDWHDVQLHLVNGRPDSFLYPLAAPRYLRRELVHPDDQLSTVPQLLEHTADEQWGENVLGGLSGNQVGESYGSGGLGLTGRGEGGGGTGYGVGIGHLGTVASSSPVLTVGNLAGVAQASGLESGALFTYTLAEKIDLRAHGSALVPFVQQSVEVRPITFFSAPGEIGRSAARVVNSTRQTLPAGPIAFFADGSFAGESGLDRLKPGERRFVQYGADLDLTVETESATSKESTRRLTFGNDFLVEHFLKQSEAVYAIANKSGHERAVYLQLSVVDNSKVTGADDLDYDTVAAHPLAIFHTAPGQSRKRTVKTEEGLSRGNALDSLSEKKLRDLAAKPELPRAERDAVAEAADAARRYEAADAALAAAARDGKQVEADVQRLRDDLKSLNTADAKSGNPFVQRILAAEDRLGELRRQTERRENEKRAARDDIRRILSRLKS
jgi:hypothetical protein